MSRQAIFPILTVNILRGYDLPVSGLSPIVSVDCTNHVGVGHMLSCDEQMVRGMLLTRTVDRGDLHGSQ